MKSAPKTKVSKKTSLLVGTWFSGNEYGSQVEFGITWVRGRFMVSATDSGDGERADVFEISHDRDAISFATYWNSTGRFVRYRLVSLSPEDVRVTYTYTDQDTYRRKQSDREA